MSNWFGNGYQEIHTGCNTLIGLHWNAFGMKREHWDQGFGYHDACTWHRPLNRTFKALELLRISKNSSFSDTVLLNNAYELSKGWISDLRSQCAKNGKDTARATHLVSGINWIVGQRGSGTVILYQNAFGGSVIDLAGTILHEARHRIKGHTAGKSDCRRGASCDASYFNYGANSYHLLYFWWYGIHARQSTTYLQDRALARARFLQDNAFRSRPSFVIPMRAPRHVNGT